MTVRKESAGVSWSILEGDCRTSLAALDAGSVRTCVTSPPYFGLRSYGVEPAIWGDSDCDHEWGDAEAVRETTYGGKTRWQHVHNGRGEHQESRADREGWLRSVVEQGRYCTRGCGAWLGCLGLEPSPEQFVTNIVEVFRSVRRVLADDGTLWLNLGDSYNADGRKGRAHMGKGKNSGYSAWVNKTMEGTKQKDLLGIPWMVAFALRADGWYLRSDIVWSKVNPMPESVTDRPTKAHEYLFLLSKQGRYFYDHKAIREPAVSEHPSGNGYARSERETYKNADGSARGQGNGWNDIGGLRNRRSVWEVPTAPFAGAHFATFPPKLVEPCILAGSAPGDMVLDPFAGSGTTGMVALRHDRSFVGCEMNPEYAALARDRIISDSPLLNTHAEAA